MLFTPPPKKKMNQIIFKSRANGRKDKVLKTIVSGGPLILPNTWWKHLIFLEEYPMEMTPCCFYVFDLDMKILYKSTQYSCHIWEVI